MNKKTHRKLHESHAGKLRLQESAVDPAFEVTPEVLQNMEDRAMEMEAEYEEDPEGRVSDSIYLDTAFTQIENEFQDDLMETDLDDDEVSEILKKLFDYIEGKSSDSYDSIVKFLNDNAERMCTVEGDLDYDIVEHLVNILALFQLDHEKNEACHGKSCKGKSCQKLDEDALEEPDRLRMVELKPWYNSGRPEPELLDYAKYCANRYDGLGNYKNFDVPDSIYLNYAAKMLSDMRYIGHSREDSILLDKLWDYIKGKSSYDYDGIMKLIYDSAKSLDQDGENILFLRELHIIPALFQLDHEKGGKQLPESLHKRNGKRTLTESKKSVAKKSYNTHIKSTLKNFI